MKSREFDLSGTSGTPAQVHPVMTGRVSRRFFLRAASVLGLGVIAQPILSQVAGDLLADAGSADNIFVVASGSPAITLDPGTVFDGQSILLWRGVYENLVTYRDDTIEIAPGLAESFTGSDDGLTYTFKLRQGVKFHDGEPFDAAAAKFNIERIRAMKVGLGYVFEDAELETPDDYTLVIRLKTPQDAFLSSLAGMWSPYMISPKAIRDNTVNDDWGAAWLRSNMVGTGPYRLKSYQKDQQATLERFDGYWDTSGDDHFQAVVVRYISDPSTLQLVLESKQVDSALWLPDDSLNTLVGSPDIKMDEYPTFSTTFFMMNCSKGPTADKRIRQAIAYAFDYDSWINKINSGRLVQARGPVARGLPSYSEDTPQYSRDLDKAKALLAEAGQADGGFSLDYTYETGYAWKREFALLLQANLKELGITLNIAEISPAAWFDLLQNPDSQPHCYGFIWFGSLMARAYDVMQLMFGTNAQGKSGLNWAYYSNPEMDAVLAEAVKEVDDDKRIALYRKAEKMIVDDSPALFLSYSKYRVPIVKEVEGYISNPMYIYTYPFNRMKFST